MIGKLLRIIGIILLGLTAVITFLGGIGTTCVALNPSAYEGMEAIAPFQWLYIFYVVAGIGIGLLGIWATYLFARRQAQGYRAALIALVSGLVIGVLHVATSRALRGSSMPKDFIVYATSLTLLVFLLFGLPGVRRRINLTGEDNHTGGLGVGAAFIVAGITTLTVGLWAGPTHTMNGVNYANVWSTQMSLLGTTLIAAGLTVWIRPLLKGTGQKMLPDRAQEPSRLVS